MAEDEKKPQNNNNLAKPAETTPTGQQGTSAPRPVQKFSIPGAGGEKAADPSSPASAAPAATPAATVAVSNLEDGIISAKLPIIAITPPNDSLKKLIDRYREDEDIKVNEATVTMAPILARQLRPCIILASITANTDVVKFLTMLKPLREELKHNRIKFILLTKINNAGIIATFEKAGCHEYIIEPIAERSLFFKVNLQTKTLKAQRKKLRAEELRRIEEAKGGKKGEAAATKEVETDAIDKNVKTEDAKETEDDRWVFKGNKPKKKGGKWTMRMKGPDPSEGDWQPAGKAPDGSTQWRFMDKDGKPKDGGDPKKKKGWEFTGDKPEFNNGEWQFEGEKPELSLVDESGNKLASKVRTDGKDGIITAKDTGTALAKVQERENKNAAEKEKKKKSLFSGEGRGADGEDGGGEGAGLGMGPGGKKEEAGGQFNALNPDSAPGAAAKNGLNSNALGNTKSQDGKNLDAKGAIDKDGKPISSGKADEQADALGSGAKNFLKKKKNAFGKSDDAADESEHGAEASLAISKDGKPLGINDKTKEADGSESGFGGRNGVGQATGAPGKDGATKESKGPSALKSAQDEKNAAKEKDKTAAKAGTPDKKRKLSELADMAMDFPDEEENATRSFDKDGKPVIGGKDNAKTEKIKNSDWQGHDLTPDELLKREEREKRQKQLKDSLGGRGKKDDAKDGQKDGVKDETKDSADAASKGTGIRGEQNKKGAKRNPLKDVDAAVTSEEEEGDDADAASGKSEEEAKPGFSDKSNTKDEPQGGWSKHREEEEKKKRKINARDSDQEAKTDDRDQMVEIDQPKGTLTHNMMGDKVWEYPPDFFGTVNGTWESAGNDSQDEKKRKCFVFLEPEIRMKKIDDVKTVATWWIFHGERPLFNVHKKVWFCKINEPKKIGGFAKLPLVVQNFLLSVSTPDAVNKKQDAEDKKKKTKGEHEEQVKKAKEEFKEQQATAVEKKKQAEEDKKSAMDELRKLDGKDEKSSKQSHKYEKAETEKSDKKSLLDDGTDSTKAKDEGKSGKDEKGSDESTSKDEKDRKKKERLKAELGLEGSEKSAKSEGKKDLEAKGESSSLTEREKKKKEKLEAKLELERTKKEGDKGKQSFDAKEEKKEDEKSKQTLDKKKEEDNSGTQKFDKKDADNDFKHAKEEKGEEKEGGSDKFEKQSDKKTKLEAELKFKEKEAAVAKEKQSAEEKSSAQKLERLKRGEKDLKNADLGLKSEEKGGNKSSHGGADGEGDQSGSSKLEKDAIDNKGIGFNEQGESVGAEEGALSAIDEALKEKTIVPLPSAPMMAVFFSENLISNNGDVQKTFDRFVKFLSQGCGGVAVTLFYVSKTAGVATVVVGASSHPHHVVGKEFNTADKPGTAEAIQARGAHYPNPDGPLFLAVNASKIADRDPIGLLMFEPLDSGMRFTKLVKYFQGIAQCLRGAIVHARSGLVTETPNVPTAAPQKEAA